MIALLAAFLVVFLLCMFLMDTLQVLLRAVATVLDAPVLGAHLGSVFMLVNRAATALALLIIGYFVDSFTNRSELQMVYALAAALIAVFHLPLLRRAPLVSLTVVTFRLFYRKTYAAETIAEIREAAKRDKPGYRLSPPVAGVAAVGLLGLLGPSLLATTFPDYRATLMQTGFIVNSVASIVNVAYVERHIAMTLHDGDRDQIGQLYTSYTVSRASGYAVSAVIFLAGLLLLP